MQWWMAGPIPEVRILFYPYAQQAYMGTGYTALSLPRTGRSGEGGNGEIRESTEALPFGSAYILKSQLMVFHQHFGIWLHNVQQSSC